MKNNFTLVLLTFLFTNTIFSQNLITNPGFELGGSGVGFVTNGAGYTLLNPPLSGVSIPGNFAFSTNPNLVNTTDFIPSADHTSGNGKMLIIDGNTTTGSPRFWKAGNTGTGITGLVVGTTYRFSYWIKSVSNLVTGPTTQADIAIQVTGSSGLTLVTGTTLAPLPQLGWRHVVYSFVATATTATIELWNINLNSIGNDFAVDDFMLTKNLMVTYNVTDALCVTPNDGSIIVSGLGGVAPYTNYTISGPVSQNNTTGIFPGIPPGIYSVSVIDSASPVVTVTMGNVVVGPSLTLNNASTICLGSATNLSAAGSVNSYSWTALPVDPSLTTPTISNPTVSPIVTTIYSVASTIGSCAVSKSVTITVNPTPTTTFTGNNTICPGNTSVISMTGSPSSTVTFVDNNTPVNTYTRIIPLSGTVTWTSPILNSTTIYTIKSIRNNANPFCQTNYTPPTAATVTITVIPNGCANVNTIPAPGTPSLDLTLCTAGECRTLQANVSDVPSTTSYAVSSIPYCPQAAFENPSWINIGPGTTFGDDDWSGGFSFPAGMNFCFYGQNYTQLNVGTNGVIRFPNPNLFNAGDTCPWAYTQTIPNTGFPITNAIFGVYQDIDFSVTPPPGIQISVNYQVVGTYPCRKFVANFTNVPQFSCGNTIGLSTSQIVLYEVSNIIEVYVQRRVACTGWNGGRGTIGVINNTGSQAVAAPGRNAAAFSTDPTPTDSANSDNISEAWRFTPTGPNVSQTINWYQGPATPANYIGTGSIIQVCPTVTTTYTLESVYDVCGVPQKASSPVTLNVNPDLTNNPINITQCSNSFNLTSNNSVILGTLTPANYTITYHTSAAQAATISNPISNPSAFVSSGQTIYVAIYINSFGCTIVKSFNIIISCGTISPVPDLKLCESSIFIGTATFDLSPQTLIAIGTGNLANYNFSYYTSQAAADAGIPGTEINPITSFLSANQIIYIRMEEVADSSVFFTTNFHLIVNQLPTITGSLIVCEGSSISLTGSASAATANPWVSSNSLVATINNSGLVTGVSTGTTTITYTNSNGCQKSVDVVVNPKPTITGLSTICLGSTTQLTGSPIAALLNPWVSLDGSVVTITDSGLVTSITAGATSINYTNTFGCKKVVSITVDPLPTITGILNVCRTLTTQLTGSATPAIANPWVSSNLLVATIDNLGLVTGVSVGTTTITYTTLTGCQVTETVTVNSLPSISGALSICSGSTTQLTSTDTPSIVNPWVSSNALVATISNTGLVTGLSAGTTTITYTTLTGCQKTATITVDPLPIITGTQNVCIGLTTQLNSLDAPATVNPWVSSNALVATISNTGLITGVSAGTTTITYTTLTGCQKTAIVAVNPLPIITGTQNVCIGLTTQLNSLDAPATVNPWVSSNALVATISNTGLITGVSAGTTTITYTTLTGCQKTAIVTVNPLPIITGTQNVCIGLTTQLNSADAPATVNSWASSNLLVATINNSGLVTGVSAGTTTITYTTLTGCQKTAIVSVNPVPAVIVPNPIFECSNGTVTTATFDLTLNQGVVTGGLPGFSVTYYTSLAAAQNGISFIISPTTYLGSDNEIVYVRVENTATGCFSITNQLLRVTEGPLAITPLPLHYCDPNNDGFGLFDLDSRINAIAGGTLPIGVSVTFHETQTDAELGANPITSPYYNIVLNTQTIYVRVFYTLTGCANYVNLQLIVDPTPVATEPDDYKLCDYIGASGYETFDLTTVIPQILGTLNPLTHTVTFYTSQADAELGTGNITNTTSYVNTIINTQTIWIRVETTATGCFDIVTLQLFVDPLPNAIQPNYPQYSKCDNDQSSLGFETFDLASQVTAILLGQTGMNVIFYPSLSEAQNNTNAITNLQYTNVPIYVQTLGIRVTNNASGCYVISTMDIRVEPLPTLTPPTTNIEACDGNQDGFGDFDLSSLVPGLLNGITTYTVSFHETLTDAQLGVNDIDTSVNYTTITPLMQMLHVRAEDTITGCWSTLPITLNVTPSPIAPINLNPITVCDQDANPQDGSTAVDLTVQEAAILAQQPLPATAYTISYYTSLPDALSQPIINITSYVTTSDEIWIRIENVATGCFNIGSFQVVINTPFALPTFLPPFSLCDYDANPNNLYHIFDLTIATQAILPLVTGATISYYPSLALAQAGVIGTAIATPTAFTNTLPGVQTLGVVVTTAAGCTSITTIDIRVLPIPIPKDPSTAVPELVLPKQCENALGSGVATVNLTTFQNYIIDGDPNINLQYFLTEQDLDNNINAIPLPTNALVGDPTLLGNPINFVQYVWIAVSSTFNTDNSGRKCYQKVKQGFIINPLPIVAPIADYQKCESLPLNGIEQFDLTTQISSLLSGNVTTPISSYSVAFYEDVALTSPINNPSGYYNTSTPQTIFVVITNTTTGCQSQVGQFNIKVNPKPTAIQPADFITCDSNADGYFTLDLSLYINGIIGTQTGVTTTFYNSQLDANTETNAIINLVNYQAYTQTVWIRVEDNLTGCYKLVPFNIIVEPLATPFITGPTNTICVEWGTNNLLSGVTLNSGITNPNYTFVWSLGGVAIPSATSSTYPINSVAAGDYTVVATSTPPLLGCISKPSNTFSVIQSGPPVFSTPPYTFSAAFDENQNITVNVVGYGVYEYSLDEGPFQASTIFTNVSAGAHTITVRDVEGITSCGQIFIDGVLIINYPHYFTPNGDGIHDTWNIVGLANKMETKIYIFDRYGKLLKQISASSNGWDGTYNGSQMPSDDYWFTVDYEDGVMKQYKAHFTLKR